MSEASSDTGAARLYERYEAIFGGLAPPFAFIDLDAMRRNAATLRSQAAGLPIRIASKSVRSVAVLRRILELDDCFSGILSFTLPEALWLRSLGFEDIVVAYPTVDRPAIAELSRSVQAGEPNAPVLMVDHAHHLDLIEATIGAGRSQIPVAIDIDAGLWIGSGRLARIGPKRSPVHSPGQAKKLAEDAVSRPGTELTGLMAYEGQIAGVGDQVPGRPFRSTAIRWMQGRSERELSKRLPEVVAAVREVTALRFINGGGTGSLARTAAAGVVTELTAGSGFYAPTLFDHYRSLALEPAALFVLSVVRRPGPGVSTALGGGYIASGSGGKERLPEPHLPPGLVLDSEEGAGEVQTPLLGAGTRQLGIGHRVYMRHAKAGELCEHFNSLYLVQGDEIVDQVPTYRGEGKAFI